MTPARSAKAPTRSERAYAAIKQRVLDNEFAPGTFVLERELADLLSMSRTPVREALIRLAKEGMVEIRPRHGMRVLPVSACDMREIFDVLTVLEAEVAAEVAGRGLSSRELAALRDPVEAMAAALEADDLGAWAAAEEDFLWRLVHLGSNRRLKAIVHQYWEQVHRVRLMTLSSRPKPVESTATYRQLLLAIERHESERARALYRRHRESTGALLVRLLRAHASSPTSPSASSPAAPPASSPTDPPAA